MSDEQMLAESHEGEVAVEAGTQDNPSVESLDGDGSSERGECEAVFGQTGHRRKGNVARLPKAVRIRVNEMLDDGRTYEEIIESLGEDGKGVSVSNLSQWKKGGYQDWLLEQRWVEQLRAQQEVSTDLVRDNDPADLNQAALQLGTFQIFKALRDLEAGGMDKRLGGDPAAFARLMNALARASRESLMLQKYRAAAAEARAAIKEMKDPHRKLTDDERRAIIAKVDEVLGINLEIPLRPAPERHGEDQTVPMGEGRATGEAEPTPSGQSSAENNEISAEAHSEPQSLEAGELTPEQEADMAEAASW